MARALYGAALLGRGRVEGLAYFENTTTAAAFSFRAAAICLPIFLFLKTDAGSGGDAAPDAAVTLILDLLIFVSSWAGFALASLSVTRLLGLEERWPRFIAAWNWGCVVQYLVLAVLSLPGWALGKGALLDLGGLVALGYALWFEWFIARTALRLTIAGAALFVVMDVALAVLLGGIAARIGAG